MSTLIVFAALAALALAYAVVRFVVPAYVRYRGTRVITCPETKQPAAVVVDASHAAWSAAYAGGRPELRLCACSRWPERAGCDQACLGEIEAAPEGTLARTIVDRWYAGRTCAYCGRPVVGVRRLAPEPGLLDRDLVPHGWTEIPAEEIPDALATDLAVCPACHIAETFRRRFPELVIDRPEEPLRKRL